MSSRFTIDTPATFEPVPIRESRWARYTGDYDSAGSFDLQPADGKLLANGDWFQSRSEHGHVLSAVVPTRGRIETTDAPGTFDYPIEALYFLDDARQWHVGKNITSGKRFTLTPVAPDIVNPILVGEIKKFSTRNNGLLRRAKERRGHFVAITTHAPGIDTHPGIRWKETRTVITGPVVSP